MISSNDNDKDRVDVYIMAVAMICIGAVLSSEPLQIKRALTMHEPCVLGFVRVLPSME